MQHLNISVPLTPDKIISYIKQIQENSIQDTWSVNLKDVFSSFDLGKSIRGNNFKVIHSLLLNPLREMISTTTPKFEGI